MTNYTKATNFAAKDSLASGNAAKVVKGTEIDTEFTNIETAVNSKSDSANPVFTGVAEFADGSASAPSITNTADTNTGLFFPAADTVGITTGGTEMARVDSSGNLGLGVTPSGWDTVFKSFDIVSTGSVFAASSNINFGYNVYYNSGYKYKTTAGATFFRANASGFEWDIAASGTAGNAITFTQAMTLNASGYLGIGTTSPSSFLHVQTGSSSYPGAILRGAGDDQGWLKFGNQSGDYYSIKAGVDYGGMLFITGGSERARIDSSGNLLVGKTTSNSTSGTGCEARATGFFAAVAPSTLADTYNYYNSTAGAYRFYVTNAGVINATSTTITAISDQRLKENIQDIDVGLDAVMALKPRKFDWKEGKGKDKKGDRGWIAQEFEQVFPDMITTWKDAPPEGEEPYKAVNADLIPVLVKAIQELNAKFEAYKAAHP